MPRYIYDIYSGRKRQAHFYKMPNRLFVKFRIFKIGYSRVESVLKLDTGIAILEPPVAVRNGMPKNRNTGTR